MKPTLIVVVIIALLLGFLLIGCTAQNPTSPSAGSSYTWDGEITTETKPEADMKKATLSFDSFDGGGPDFSAVAEDPSILSWTQKNKYHDPNHEKMNGAGFTVIFTFTGTKPGSTRLLIEERSPIAGNYDHIYAVTVAEDLSVSLVWTETRDLSNPAVEPVPTLAIEVGDKLFYAALADNSSAEALVEKLSEGPVTLELHDYGNFEKVGPLPWELPRNDETITTKPGDIILYQGNQITIYYDENTWSFTRLARIEGETRESILEALGPSDTTITLWIEWSE